MSIHAVDYADASVSTDDPTLFSTLFYSLIASTDDLFDTFLLFDRCNYVIIRT